MPDKITFLGDFSKKLVTNTFFNFLGRSWSFVLALLLTPFILSHLNVRDFGTWALLSIFISSSNLLSANLLDFGFGFSFLKYISEFYTYEDDDGINRVLVSGLVFYTLYGLVFVAAGLFVQKPLFQLFHLSGASSTVYVLVLISSAVSNVAAMFLSILKGIQR